MIIILYNIHTKTHHLGWFKKNRVVHGEKNRVVREKKRVCMYVCSLHCYNMCVKCVCVRARTAGLHGLVHTDSCVLKHWAVSLHIVHEETDLVFSSIERAHVVARDIHTYTYICVYVRTWTASLLPGVHVLVCTGLFCAQALRGPTWWLRAVRHV
jgi:hypothetical protein